MKAIRYVGPGHIEVAEVPRPKPKADEALVETRAVSICNQTDIRTYNGALTSYPLEPGAPGREGAGVVVEVGSAVKNLKVGTPVAMLGSNLYAEYSLRRPDDLVALKTTTSFVEAAPLGLAGCVLAALKKVGSLRGRSVVVTGLGPAGLFLVQAARQARAQKIIALDIKSNPFELAKSLGATTSAFANDREIINACRETPADLGVECSGSPQAVSLLYSMCSSVLVFSHVDQSVRIDIPTARPATLVNGYLTDDEQRGGLDAAVRLFFQRKLLTRPLITQTMPLEEYALAIQKVRRGEALKLVLTRS